MMACGHTSRAFQCCCLCTVFPDGDDAQLPADEALHVGFDVCSGNDGFETHPGVPKSLYRRLWRRVVLNVQPVLAFRHGLMAVKVSVREADT